MAILEDILSMLQAKRDSLQPQLNPKPAEPEAIDSSFLDTFFKNSGVSKTPSVEAPDGELDSVASTVLSGALLADKPITPPSLAQFKEQFRKDNSPARTLLADFMGGLGASMLGQKYVGVRQRYYDQWIETEKARVQAEAQNRQYAQMQAQVASQLYRQRQDQQMKADVTNAMSSYRDAKTDQDRAKAMATLEITRRKYNLDVDKMKLMTQKFDFDKQVKTWEMQDTGNALFDAGRRIALAKLQAQGVDLKSPQATNQLWQESVKEWQNLYSTQEKIQGANRPAPQPYVVPVSGPDGNTYMAFVDKQQQRVIGGAYVGRNLKPDQLDAINQLRNGSAQIRNALSTAQNSPDAIGSFAQQFPPDIRARIGQLKPAERNLRLYMNMAVASYIQSISGKAVTDKERQFLTEGLPKVYEKQENFFPAAYAFAGMLDAAAMRSQYGIEIDFVKPMQAYSAKMQDYIKKHGSAAGLPILSSQQFMDLALKSYGKKLRQGPFGTMEVVNDNE